MTATASLEQDIVDRVEEHAFSVTTREVGGVLVGHLTESGVRVTASIPALRARENQMHVTFTHDVWEDVLTTIDRDYPGQQIVGWYHTHPGFGLFLSDYDVFIHKNFFSDARMVALVIDPVAGKAGWFGWVGESVELQEEHSTTRPAVHRRAPSSSRPANGGAARGPRVVAAAAAFAILGAVGGYLLSEVERRDEDALHKRQLAAVSSQLDVAQRQLADAEKPAGPVRRSDEDSVRKIPASVEYRVRAGDTLWSLASSFYGDSRQWRRILRFNDRTRGGAIQVGQVLRIPLVGH